MNLGPAALWVTLKVHRTQFKPTLLNWKFPVEIFFFFLFLSAGRLYEFDM